MYETTELTFPKPSRSVSQTLVAAAVRKPLRRNGTVSHLRYIRRFQGWSHTMQLKMKMTDTTAKPTWGPGGIQRHDGERRDVDVCSNAHGRPFVCGVEGDPLCHRSNLPRTTSSRGSQTVSSRAGETQVYRRQRLRMVLYQTVSPSIQQDQSLPYPDSSCSSFHRRSPIQPELPPGDEEIVHGGWTILLPHPCTCHQHQHEDATEPRRKTYW